jgi:hypothetical protein
MTHPEPHPEGLEAASIEADEVPVVTDCTEVKPGPAPSAAALWSASSPRTSKSVIDEVRVTLGTTPVPELTTGERPEKGVELTPLRATTMRSRSVVKGTVMVKTVAAEMAAVAVPYFSAMLVLPLATEVLSNQDVGQPVPEQATVIT